MHLGAAPARGLSNLRLQRERPSPATEGAAHGFRCDYGQCLSHKQDPVTLFNGQVSRVKVPTSRAFSCRSPAAPGPERLSLPNPPPEATLCLFLRDWPCTRHNMCPFLTRLFYHGSCRFPSLSDSCVRKLLLMQMFMSLLGQYFPVAAWTVCNGPLGRE